MTQPAIPAPVQAEFAAAISLARKSRPAGLVLRLSCDAAGEIRLRLEGVEGITLQALVPIDSECSIEKT